MGKSISKKKKLIIVISILAIAGIAAGVLLFLTEDDAPRSPYPEVEHSGYFAIVDDAPEDIFKDEEYLGLDRNLYLKNGGEEYAVNPEIEEVTDEGALFFLEYFDAIANGDCERYNSMFSDAYYEKFLPQEEFTQQMIYDKHIELISRTEDGDTLNLVYYVDYKIHRNNGTFRRDILHDATRKLCFVLSGTADNLKIDSITY